jgi:hypothetical protein
VNKFDDDEIYLDLLNLLKKNLNFHLNLENFFLIEFIFSIFHLIDLKIILFLIINS